MRGFDPDSGHAGGPDPRPAGYGHAKRESRATTDERVAVVRAEHPLGFDQSLVKLPLRLVDRLAKGGVDGLDPRPQLIGRDGPNVDAH